MSCLPRTPFATDLQDTLGSLGVGGGGGISPLSQQRTAFRHRTLANWRSSCSGSSTRHERLRASHHEANCQSTSFTEHASAPWRRNDVHPISIDNRKPEQALGAHTQICHARADQKVDPKPSRCRPRLPAGRAPNASRVPSRAAIRVATRDPSVDEVGRAQRGWRTPQAPLRWRLYQCLRLGLPL